jgi:hypothetical protein
MTDTRTVPVELLQQALEALAGFLRFAAIHSDGPDASDKYLAEDYAEEAFLKTAKVLPALRAVLEEPVPHGCHCDLEEGMEPDGCVLDEGRPQHCSLAGSLLRAGKDKTDCEYWRPIEVKR